jgi:hypothetical protein
MTAEDQNLGTTDLEDAPEESTRRWNVSRLTSDEGLNILSGKKVVASSVPV